MTHREQKIAGLVRDLRAMLDGKRSVTLLASASPELQMGSGIGEAIWHATEVARHTYEQAKADNLSEANAKEMASEAYVFALPELDLIANVRCFIAAVAAGVRRGYITGPQARLLLYTAQLQLAAMTRKVSA